MYIIQQAGATNGITQQKNKLFENMAALLVKSSRKAMVYAVDQEDDALQALFDVQQTDLEKLGETDALALIESVHAALQPLSGQLDDYRVTLNDITAIGDAIAVFKTVASSPENAQAASEAGTKGIEATIPLMDKNLYLLDDLIVHGMDEDPGLVDEYRSVRRINDMSVRHTGLVASINDAASGNGIEGAAMLVEELDKKATSDILGVAAIESMKPGMYRIIFSADGYVTQTQVLKIEQGKTPDIEVRMVREN